MKHPANCRFDELVATGKLAVGDGYRAKNDELGGDGLIFLRSAYLQNSGFIFDGPDRFSSAIDPTTFGPKISRYGDVVITTKGNSTGRVGRIRNEQVGAVYSPHLSYWRSLDDTLIDQCFLYYWSLSNQFQVQLHGMAHSTDMAPYFSLRDQLRLRISLPSICAQRAIALILGSLDDKIELNRRMNETLEAMAQAIFRDWFVEFGPTRRKLSGITDPIAIMGGLVQDVIRAAELAALFPGMLGDNGLPEGWGSEPLLDQADWINGAAYKNMHFNDAPDALPVIKIAELKAGVTGTTKRTNTQLGERYRIKDGELLFSWSGNPDTSIDTFVWTGGSAWLNQHIFAVRENGKRSAAYLHTLLRYLRPEFAELARNKQTTGLGHVTKENMSRLLVTVPIPEISVRFDEIVGPIHERFRAALFEVNTLAATRDLLLPKLMSGEIRLRDAEAIAEAAQ